MAVDERLQAALRTADAEAAVEAPAQKLTQASPSR